jgi:outer membrane protein OmpA-like peptidoglycan-associated protein
LAYQEVYKRVLLDEEKQVIIPFFEYILDGIVADRKSGEMIPNAKVVFSSGNEEVEMLMTDSSGQFVSKLVDRKQFGYELAYTVSVSADGYLMATYELNTKLAADSLISLSYILDKKEIGTDLGPFMIYYNFDKFDIREDAKVELDKIVKIMNENPEVKIELGSHTDCRGSWRYNSRLSKKRAKSAADYIAKRIINSERIVSKGYGESQPVSDCNCGACSKEEHQLNRRTEFIIIP